MRPTIVSIDFFGEDDVPAREIHAHLSDGGCVHITGIESAGQKSYEQYNATVDQMWATLALAKAATPWLHGKGPRPDERRFIRKDK